MTDGQHLLAEFAKSGSEDAFRELVTRYLDLVHSAALRIVAGDTHLAEDVSQTVFLDLARKARTLPSDVMLGGWLHRNTCFVAAKIMRSERRRQYRERQAVEMNALQDHSKVNFSQLAPVLDQAINELDEPDRTAILLRFFEGQEFHKLGQRIGSSEDAARMRVSRALERLEMLLKSRGITSTGSALSLALSAHVVQAAPAGLASSISTAALAGATLSTTTAAAVTKTIAMTTIQKSLVAATVAALAGAGIYEMRQNSRLREANHQLQQQQAPLTEQLLALQKERDEATNRVAWLSDELASLKTNSTELAKLRGQVAGLKSANSALASSSADPAQQAAKSWADRVTQLKERLEQTPNAKIPELKYLTEAHWLEAARKPLLTDDDFRRAFASLRHAGENQFLILMQPAIQGYLKQTGGQFPSDLAQLKPYFETAPDDSLLQRYSIVPAATIPNLKVGTDWLITVKSPVDEDYDTRWALGEYGFGSTSYHSVPETAALAPALQAYMAANNGQEPKDATALLPYLTTPEQQAAYQKLMQRRSSAAK